MKLWKLDLVLAAVAIAGAVLAIVIGVTQAHGLSCIADGGPCSNTSTPCCLGLVPSDPLRKTGCQCVTGTSTTTSTTATTGPSSSSTTSTLPGPSSVPDLAVRFSPYTIGLTSFFDTNVLLDPRNGLASNEHVRATIAYQWMALSADFVNYADFVGCPVNDVAVDDALWKFGLNYVLRPSTSYQWFHPSYVHQYLSEVFSAVVACAREKGLTLTPELQQLAGQVSAGLDPAPSPYPSDPNAGLLVYTAGHYRPLTPEQCSALAAAENAHMVHDQALLAHDQALADQTNVAVVPAQLAFERTAQSVDQEQLFTFIWNGTYNRANPQDVLDGLTSRIIAHHHAWTEAFGCAGHVSPDAKKIERELLWHNQLHWCRATVHDLDRAIRTVCDTTTIDDCPHLTCRQQAAA